MYCNGDVHRFTLVANVHSDLDLHLQQFWETEESILQCNILNPDEEKSELHCSATRRQKIFLSIPIQRSVCRRLKSMERKFALCELYVWISESKTYGGRLFLRTITQTALKLSSTTTNIRVLFDVSYKSPNSLSLSDNLLVATTNQNDLYTVLVKFRKFEIHCRRGKDVLHSGRLHYILDNVDTTTHWI